MMQIADALFSDLLSGADNNLSWVESARNTFLAVLRVIVDGSREDTGNRRLISALRGMPVERLLAYISRHPRNHSLLSKDFGYPIHDPDSYRPTRRAGDILFFLNQVLERFSGNFASDGTDTIHDYLHGAYGRDLFLLHDLAAAERSRPFLLYFLSKLKDEKMSLSSDVRDPMLWCLDEADKLADGGRAADFGLFQAATLGREYGLQVLLTTQSLESLFGLAPDFNEHIARSGLAGFPMLLAFRPGDPATVEALQTLFGSTRREIVSLPLSRYDQPAVRSEREALVTDGDFASLGVGECYGKLAACPPVRLCFLPPR